MKICIAGWHFLENNILTELKKIKYPVFIVSHRTSFEAKKLLEDSGIDFWIKDNTGLEFGTYNWYHQNKWSGDNVLFLHDDIQILDFKIFDQISELKVDQAYIFESEKQSVQMGRKHGRAIFISEQLLEFLKTYECECLESYDRNDTQYDAIFWGSGKHKGIWFDSYNHGHSGVRNFIVPSNEKINDLIRPVGIKDHNAGIRHFDESMIKLKERYNVRNQFYTDKIKFGIRNKF
jgi:hypothetical protein